MAISFPLVTKLFTVLLATGCCSAAVAGARGDWFKSLRMPGTAASCCDLADCHPTDAEWRKDRWWAVVDDEWQAVPQSKVLKSPHSIDGVAYICTGSQSRGIGGDKETPIYCFVPPNLPM